MSDDIIQMITLSVITISGAVLKNVFKPCLVYLLKIMFIYTYKHKRIIILPFLTFKDILQRSNNITLTKH